MMKLRSFKFIIINIIVIILSCIITFIGCMLLIPQIYVEENSIEVLVNSEVEYPKYKAYLNHRNITSRVKKKGWVNNKKIGKYIVDYGVNYSIFHIKKRVLFQVVDKEKPIIELVGEENVYLCPNNTYQEEGYKAIDNYDGDITSRVKVISNKDKIIYQVKDSSNNKVRKLRNIYYEDKIPPKLELSGSEMVTLYQGNSYYESGYKAIDNCDGDITSKVKVVNTVNVNQVGTYTITYQIEDSYHNESKATRTVKVIPKNFTDNKGVIYLTFDDGPSKTITDEVLRVLKEEGVKATFFVINHSDTLNYLIKKEYQEGHTVALHSYSHNYAKVYQSSAAYFEDLEKIQDKVYNITGERSKIIRFPGGSSNSISKKYNQGIMSRLTSEVANKGYRYFDWNISSGDAGGVKSSNEVYQNVIGALSHNRSNVVLMHDFENNYYTLNALRDIIRYGKAHGYRFDRITNETPMVIHKVAN